MSELTALAGRDVFMRYTGADGKSHVMQHRCHDADLFVATRQREYAKLAEEAVTKGESRGKSKAERITEEQYRNERNAK